jgi:hypothetical protein
MSRSKFQAIKARLGLKKVASAPVARREETAALERRLASAAPAKRSVAQPSEPAPGLAAPTPVVNPRRAGEDARANGAKVTANPYRKGTAQHRAWETGWRVEHQRLGGRRAA